VRAATWKPESRNSSLCLPIANFLLVSPTLTMASQQLENRGWHMTKHEEALGERAEEHGFDLQPTLAVGTILGTAFSHNTTGLFLARGGTTPTIPFIWPLEEIERYLERLDKNVIRHKRRWRNETIYCALGWKPNQRTTVLGDLADRTSTATMRDNQLRRYFSSIADILMYDLRRLALKGTGLEPAMHDDSIQEGGPHPFCPKDGSTSPQEQ